MEGFVSALTTAIGSTQLWAIFTKTLPFLTVVILFTIGVYFIRRMIKGVAKGKAKV